MGNKLKIEVMIILMLSWTMLQGCTSGMASDFASQDFASMNSVAKLMNSESTSSPEAGGAVVGVWGGRGVILTAGDDGGQFEFECGDGSFEGPLVVGSSGGFNIAGSYVMRGGPTPMPVNGTVAGAPVHFIGTVIGNTMTLRVSFDLTAEDTTAGWIPALEEPPFLLNAGVTPRLHRCY